MEKKKTAIKESGGSHSMSEDTKTIITVFVLIFAYPIGVILMWFFPNWPKEIKTLLSVPVILFTLLMVALVVFAITSWKHGNDESARIQRISNICNVRCKEVAYPNDAECFNKCTTSYGIDYKRRYMPAVNIPTQAPSY